MPSPISPLVRSSSSPSFFHSSSSTSELLTLSVEKEESLRTRDSNSDEISPALQSKLLQQMTPFPPQPTGKNSPGQLPKIDEEAAPLRRSKACYNYARLDQHPLPFPQDLSVVPRSKSYEDISPVPRRKIPTSLRPSISDPSVFSLAAKINNKQCPSRVYRNPLYTLSPEHKSIVNALISRNPLYWDDSEQLSAWAGTISKRNFDVIKGAQELKARLDMFERRHERAIRNLIEIRKKLEVPRDVVNFDKMLAHVLITISHEKIIYPFLISSGMDIPSFARTMLDVIGEAKVPDPDFLVIISRITGIALPYEKQDTLFREENLPSSLASALGVRLWATELKGTRDFIVREMTKEGSGQLLLAGKMVEEAIKKREPAFSALPRMEQERTILLEQQQNAWRFVKFGRRILEKIYATSIPQNFSILLKSRRDHISRFLQANPQKSIDADFIKSRIFVAEVLCLRILNPQILAIPAGGEERAVLTSLTKVIQSLANETPPGERSADPGYGALKSLYNEFLPKYQAFLDRCSTK